MHTVADLNERDTRFKRLRAAMAEAELDALIIAAKGHWWSGRGYFRYLTDFGLWAHDGLILFPLEGEPMFTLSSGALASMVADRGWISDARGDIDVSTEIVKAVKEKGLDRSKIGLAGRHMILPVGVHEILIGGLPDVDFVDADMLMDRTRAIKSPLEIQQQRELWDVAKQAMERFVEVLEPGKTDYELTAEPQKLLIENGCRDVLRFLGGVPSGKVVNLEDIVSYHLEIEGPSGHWCELTVAPMFRPITDLEEKRWATELRIFDEICKMAVPGVTLKEMADTMERVYLEDGWTLKDTQAPHHDFHGQGIDVIEWPWYGPLDDRQGDVVLQAGMCFSYHPRRDILPEVRGTGINQNIVITEEGAKGLAEPWDMRWRAMV
ncbi:MAG: aminopeptidase P family protein [Chloroflexi bacterium]|nr:aminopeptidase P family protein [Chloroflexota bacterium]